MPRELELFKEGFDSCLSEALPSFCSVSSTACMVSLFEMTDHTIHQTLHPSAQKLITEMYSQRLRSPDELISRISYEYPEETGSDIDLALVDAFTLWFSQYLRGVGHLDHPQITAIVPAQDILAVQDHAMFRCEQFLQQVSGARLLPLDQMVYVSIHKFDPDFNLVEYDRSDSRRPCDVDTNIEDLKELLLTGRYAIVSLMSFNTCSPHPSQVHFRFNFRPVHIT